MSSPLTARAFLSRHIEALSEQYQVHLAANEHPDVLRQSHPACTDVHRVRIERPINPFLDLQGVSDLLRLFRREHYAAVHSLTPKAGLLTAIAGYLARVPVRIHTFTGQVWATRRGAGRWLLRTLDRVIASLNTHALVDSRTQRDFLEKEGVLGREAGTVLGSGSICGVDTNRFRPDVGARAAVRTELEIPETAVVFVFVGRLTRDKGVLDLAQAFAKVAGVRADAFLLLVGPDEDALEAAIRQAAGKSVDRVRFVGLTNEPERYMSSADVFCLPSYREGFGAVVIEAAACGIPSVGSNIYGVIDAVEQGKTGLLVPAGDVSAWTAAMNRLAADPLLRRTLGDAARSRAMREFAQPAVTAEWVAFYRRHVPSQPRGRGATS